MERGVLKLLSAVVWEQVFGCRYVSGNEMRKGPEGWQRGKVGFDWETPPETLTRVNLVWKMPRNANFVGLKKKSLWHKSSHVRVIFTAPPTSQEPMSAMSGQTTLPSTSVNSKMTNYFQHLEKKTCHVILVRTPICDCFKFMYAARFLQCSEGAIMLWQPLEVLNEKLFMLSQVWYNWE